MKIGASICFLLLSPLVFIAALLVIVLSIPGMFGALAADMFGQDEVCDWMLDHLTVFPLANRLGMMW